MYSGYVSIYAMLVGVYVEKMCSSTNSVRDLSNRCIFLFIRSIF